MTDSGFTVGAYVAGGTAAPRALVRHPDLLAAYADGLMIDRDATGEAYLSHFAFGPGYVAHYHARRRSVAGYAGPCGGRHLVLDIDSPDLAAALADARKLVAYLHRRYPECEGDVPVYFSGAKGLHVLVELAHRPPPAVGFHAVAKTFARTLAAAAGVRIDESVYDVNRLVRLPNTKHPRTGLFKRRLDADALFALDADAVRRHAAHPAGDGLPTARTCPERLTADWSAAERATARAAQARAAVRRDAAAAPDARAPKYLVDLLRFGVGPGERHATLFRAAAWLTEQGAPPALCHALLTEPGCDVGLPPADVRRQIDCGIRHADRQRAGAADPDAVERRAVEHEADPLPPGALDFPFGALAPGGAEGGPA